MSKKIKVPKLEKCESCGTKAIAIGAVTVFVPLKRKQLAVTSEIQRGHFGGDIPALCRTCFADYVVAAAEKFRD